MQLKADESVAKINFPTKKQKYHDDLKMILFVPIYFVVVEKLLGNLYRFYVEIEIAIISKKCIIENGKQWENFHGKMIFCIQWMNEIHLK